MTLRFLECLFFQKRKVQRWACSWFLVSEREYFPTGSWWRCRFQTWSFAVIGWQTEEKWKSWCSLWAYPSNRIRWCEIHIYITLIYCILKYRIESYKEKSAKCLPFFPKIDNRDGNWGFSLTKEPKSIYLDIISLILILIRNQDTSHLPASFLYFCEIAISSKLNYPRHVNLKYFTFEFIR